MPIEFVLVFVGNAIEQRMSIVLLKVLRMMQEVTNA
jgi:hypothetical protein